MDEKFIKNEIRQLTDIEHALLRSQTYIGSTTLTTCSTFVWNKETSKFEYKTVQYVPAFLKIIYEICDNSFDEAIRCLFKKGTTISINIDRQTNRITIKDDGRGIPLDNAKDSDISQLELALANLKAGSNFDDNAGRNLLGQNGVGGSLTNIFSKEFTAIVYDGTRKGVLKCANNLSEKSCKIKPTKSDKTGTTIEFVPDLERFGLTEIDDVHIDMIYQRLMFLSYTYPEIKVRFNGETIRIKNAKNILSNFSDSGICIYDDNNPSKYMIGVIPNDNDDFTHKSFINGADCIYGGNHIEYIHEELVKRIREKLAKKYSSIRPGDIKNKLSYIVNFREFINPQFSSQTKESFASPVSEIKKFLKDVDWDGFAAKICNKSEIIDPIVETFKIKEELKNRLAIDKVNSQVTKKFKCKGYLPATNNKKYFAIVEGLSALGGLSNGLGRKEIGFMATRGVPLNAYNSSLKEIFDNEELKNIIKCLGLKFGEDNQKMTYENVVLANDADCDGSHIAGIYIALFYKYFPNIVKNGRLKKLRTPIMTLNDSKNKIKEIFFTISEYTEYLDKHKDNKLKEHYYKGLGSWEADDLKMLVDKYGLDYFVETIVADKDSQKYLDDWVNKSNADIRKEYLIGSEFDIFNM